MEHSAGIEEWKGGVAVCEGLGREELVVPFALITSDLVGVFWQPSRMASSYIRYRRVNEMIRCSRVNRRW